MRSERGILLILFAAISAVLVGLCALVIGLGMHLSNATRIRNIVNAAALAAIEEYVSLGYTNLSYDAKIDSVLERVNLILEKNYVPGFRDPSLQIGKVYLEGLDQGHTDSAGVLRPGRMYPRQPDDNSDPCEQNYPCLKYYAGNQTGDVVNAFQLELKTRADNPFVLPFARIFGRDTFTLGATATATLVERCTTFLLDISLSVYAETHQTGYATLNNNFPANVIPPPPPADPPTQPYKYIKSPQLVSVPVLKYWNAPYLDCSLASNFDYTQPNYLDNLIYCNMAPQRNFGGTLIDNTENPPIYNPGMAVPGVSNIFPWDGSPIEFLNGQRLPGYPVLNASTSLSEYVRHHYRDDFRLYTLYDGTRIRYDNYVDGIYQGPEPFTSHLKAINVALQTLRNQQTASDLASLKVFSGMMKNEIPPFLNGDYPPQVPHGFTSDLNYLLQVSDPRNIGQKSLDLSGNVVFVSATNTPNFLDHGWFTYLGGEPHRPRVLSSTNLVEILDLAIAQMQSCPVNAKKQIILITDGISDCSYVTHSSETERNPNENLTFDERLGNPHRTCSPEYDNYLLSERQLVGEAGGTPYLPPLVGGDSGPEYPSILSRLIESEIALTVLLNGTNVQPNFINIADPNPPCDADHCDYLDFLRAAALGFGSLGYPAPGSCGSPSCDFFDASSTCPGSPPADCDANAWLNSNSPGFVFRRPNAILGRMAMRTGGLWCPLMPQDPVSEHYGSNGYMLNQFRPEGSTQVYSVLNIPKSLFAANCAAAAVGYNPYMLNQPTSTTQAQ